MLGPGEIIMKTFAKTLVACAALVLPFAASAQSNDAKYCGALGDKYTTYVLGSGGRSHNTASPDITNAISRCSSNAAASIPVLEKALTDAKVNLPPRG
jgi:hypothetical protein